MMVSVKPAGHAHPRRLAFLDGWRGLSILAVLVGHFGRLGVAVPGVEMFFVLSGRLMAEILFVEEFQLGEFYRRRFARIYPALLVFIVVTSIALRRSWLAIDPRFAAAGLLLIYNYLAAAGHHAMAMDHIWSLCVEEHGYLLLGLLAFCARRKGAPVVATLFVGAALSMVDGVLSNLLLHQSRFSLYWRSDTHLASIFVSAAIFLVLRGREGVPRWLAPLGAVGGMAVFLSGVPQLPYTLGTTLFALGVCSLDRTWPWLQSVLSWKPLTYCGLLSYSLYLWQQPFYWESLAHHSAQKVTAATAAAAIAAALASYYVVERPARRFLNQLGLKRPTAVEVAGSREA